MGARDEYCAADLVKVGVCQDAVESVLAVECDLDIRFRSVDHVLDFCRHADALVRGDRRSIHLCELNVVAVKVANEQVRERYGRHSQSGACASWSRLFEDWGKKG